MKHTPFISFITVLCITLLLIGCDESSGPAGTSGDPEAAQEKVNEANIVLADVLFDLINAEDIEEPSEIDFTRPYDLYMEALSLDRNHAGANFGCGILEVLMLTQDQDIKDTFDQWKEFGEQGGIFEADGPLGGPVSIGPIFRLDEVNIPYNTPVKLTRRMCRIAGEDDPGITDLQNTLIAELIPRLNTAIERLDKVTDDPEFTFNVTPRMQGDENEDPVELDLTEVFATLAGLNATKAYLLHSCAYNFNFTDYTGEELLAALTPGSPFMALHPQGRSRMSSARQSWVNAVNSLEQGINFFEAETDPQGDDLIRIDPGDEEDIQEGLDSLKHYIPRIRNCLTTSETFTFEIDDEEKDLEISLASFYNTPVTDLKTLFPNYEVELEVRATDWYFVSGDTTEFGVLDLNEQRNCTWRKRADYEYGEIQWTDENIDIYIQDFDEAWNRWEQLLIDKPYAYLSFSFSGYFSAGHHEITCWVYYSYDEPTAWAYAPRITWEADNYNEWILPDPTFGGLFPGMTDARFKDLFEISGEDWRKTDVMELW